MFESFKKFACKSCYHVGRPTLKFPGSAVVELILWLFFLIPGVLYTMWRRSSGKWSCSECGAIEIVSIDTPMGKKIVAEMSVKASVA